MITKRRTVLERNEQIGEGLFQYFEKFDDEHNIEIHMSMLQPDWRELGSPEKITVTIEPGDQLL